MPIRLDHVQEMHQSIVLGVSIAVADLRVALSDNSMSQE